MFDQLGLVGRLQIALLGKRLHQEFSPEHLRRLGLPQSLARNGCFDQAVGGDSLQGAGDSDARNRSTGLLGRFEDAINPLFYQQWPSGVVNGYEVHIGLDSSQAIADRVAAFCSAGNDFDIHECQVWRVLLLKEFHIIRRNHDQGLDNVVPAGEVLGGPQPDGAALEFQEDLLAVLHGEPRAFSGCGEDDGKLRHE